MRPELEEELDDEELEEDDELEDDELDEDELEDDEVELDELEELLGLDEEEALDELDELLLEPPEAVLPPQAVRLKTVNNKTRLCRRFIADTRCCLLLSGCDDWITKYQYWSNH